MNQIKCLLNKLNKTCVWIAIMHWGISFFTDAFIFSYVRWDFSNMLSIAKTLVTYGCKLVFLFVLIGFWQWIYYLVKEADRRFIKWLGIYFVLNLCMLLLTFPGIFRMDEFGILSNALKLQPVFWQNYLTSLFYIFSLMLIPIPSGVIIVQMFVNSCVVGYLLSDIQKWLEEKTGRSSKCMFLGLLPFCFFPVLDSNLYPMRMNSYAFLELLLIYKLFRGYKEEKKNSYFIQIAVIGAIVTVWRSEAIYYLPAVIVLLFVRFYKGLPVKEIAKNGILFVLLTLLLLVPQQLGNKLTSGNEYDLTSMVLPLVPLVHEAVKYPQNQELLEKIDQVINVELADKGAVEGRSGISLYWSEPDFKRDYTPKQYRAFKKAYYQLIVKYPKTFLAERVHSFITCNGLLEDTTQLFTKKDVLNYDTFKTYPLAKPMNDSLRTLVIKILELRSISEYEKTLPGYGFVYSAIPAICILIGVGMCCLFQKQYFNALLLATPLAKVPLIFLTAPSRLFMYYYSVYLIGYGLIFFLFLRWLNLRKQEK